LLADLIVILQEQCNGDYISGEGAVETMQRIIRERDMALKQLEGRDLGL